MSLLISLTIYFASAIPQQVQSSDAQVETLPLTITLPSAEHANEPAPISGIHGNLVKRGQCISSRTKNPSNPAVELTTWQCSPETPTVAECIEKIQEMGNVGNKVSVFYTALDGQVGLVKCKQYFACHPELGQTVLWDGVVDQGWLGAQGFAIAQAQPNTNPGRATDPFQKRLSQAFGEASKGDAYICMPEGVFSDDVFDQRFAWGGWEYPALTRNSDITKIVRLDPDTESTRQIWTQGDPPTQKPPKG